MIINANKNNKLIYKSWRENGVKKEEKLRFRPYFFVKDTESRPPHYQVSKYIQGEFEYEEGEFYNLQRNKLVKVYYESGADRKAKDKFRETYEADVPYTFRYAVDEIEEMPEYDMRKWYWDMEWQQGGQHDSCITTIVMYDNYDKEYYQWAWFPNKEPYDGFKMSTDKVAHMMAYNNEKDMIEDFLYTMVDKDPDMLIAWFGNFADIPKLLERCCALDINPLIMSPINYVKGIKLGKNDKLEYTKKNGFSSIEQPIAGRITLNLDLAFERQWNDSQRGTLPSLSLDYVSKLLFDEGKQMNTKFEDPNEFYRRGWLEDTEAYLNYALVDVELLVRIDETNFCSEAIIALQRLLKAPFDACFYASHMGSIYFMRNAWWKAPTGDRNVERREYDGAMIYDPLSEQTQGLHLNVAAFDFAGLYPSMMIARNISWETKSNEPTEFAVNIAVPRDFTPVTKTNMLYYKTDELGLLPKALLELKEMRNKYKQFMRSADNKEDYQKWHNNQMAIKRLMASFYGVLAFQGFGWADVDLAASITASAREAIRLAAFKAKELKI